MITNTVINRSNIYFYEGYVYAINHMNKTTNKDFAFNELESLIENSLSYNVYEDFDRGIDKYLSELRVRRSEISDPECFIPTKIDLLVANYLQQKTKQFRRKQNFKYFCYFIQSSILATVGLSALVALGYVLNFL